MSDVIRLLPESIANQIAAGEVVPGPSYIVKELLENSIDAGATNIKLEVIDGGRACIHVVDNGKGMTPADARMAFEKHATSKISTSEDLYRLATMGFRGEALAAIAAVARVELNTRPPESELGTRILIAGSAVSSVDVVACSLGTSIQVKDVFFNTPARRRFLNKPSSEYRAILREFERVALVNPSVAMSIYKDEVLDIDLPASSLKKRILLLGGSRLEKDLLPVQYESDMVRIAGYIGKPSGARKTGAQQFLFVNNRYMEHRRFRSAIMKIYEPLIQAKYYPNFYVYFTLPPENIDVNINPTKTEVRFVDEEIIFQILQSLVREALSAHAAVPLMSFDEPMTHIPTYTGRTDVSAEPAVTPRVTYGRRVFMGRDMPLPVAMERFEPAELEGTSSYNLSWDSLAESFEKAEGSGLAGQEPKELFSLREMDRGQINIQAAQYLVYKKKYIVTMLRGGLTLINFTRAMQRILYDRYMADMNEMKLQSNELLYPEVLELSPAELDAFADILPQLAQWGFRIEREEGVGLKILAMPSVISNAAPDVLQTLLADYMEDRTAIAEGLQRYLALSMVELNAQRQTDRILEVDHKEFIAELFASSDPNLAPNGKKIVVTLADAELERMFLLI